MRFAVLSSFTLLAATLTSGLVIPASSGSGDLAARSELIDDAYDSAVYRRAPRSSNAKKARIAAAKPAKAAAKAANRAKNAAIRAEHKKTINMPKRNAKFNVPAGGGKPAQQYTGKDVRKAIYNGHKEAHRVKTASPPLSKTQLKKSTNKNFNNHNHRTPQPGGPAKSLPGMHVNPAKSHSKPGREVPLPNKAVPGTPSPARVITQKTKKGKHAFMGVISHDQSRSPGTPGYNDHFQVKAKNPRRRL